MTKRIHPAHRSSGHSIALYIRVSTEEQAENPEGSIKSQEQRLTANMQARSGRGLYNGGIISLGYKAVSGKKGYLEVDKDTAPLVKAAFHAILTEQTLAKAATWLNKEGYRIPKQMKGGGYKP